MNSRDEDLRAPLDESQLLARVSGDRILLREIAGLFIAESPVILKEIREAVAAGDATRTFEGAHKIKGSVANFSAPQAYEAAVRLERIARQGSLDQAGRASEDLEREIGRVRQALMELVARD
jgi:HPt (histidine-containing phosphotransfer) domain-containing protein